MDASKAIASAQRAIAKNGRDATLVTYLDTSSPGEVKPWRGVGTCEVGTEARAVLTGISKGHRNEQGVDTGIVQEEATALVAGGLEREPTVNDRLRFEGEPEWRVDAVERVAPAGTTILFKLKVVR